MLSKELELEVFSISGHFCFNKLTLDTTVRIKNYLKSIKGIGVVLVGKSQHLKWQHQVSAASFPV